MIAPLLAYLVTLALLAASIAFGLTSYGIEVTAGQSPLIEQLVVFGPMVLAYGTVGALLWARRPRNPIGYLFAFVAFCVAASQVATAYAVLARGTPDAAFPYVVWIGERLNNVMFGAALMALPLYPSGTLRTRVARVAAVLLIAAGVLIQARGLAPGQLSDEPVSNPFGVPGLESFVTLAADAGAILLYFGFLASLVAVIVRYRGGGAVERLQLKWLLLASLVSAAGIVVATIGLDSEPISTAGFIVFVIGLAFIPVAVAIAILRYGLYDIDVLINRTLVYGALTGTLGAAFVVSIVLLQTLLRGLTQGSELAIAASTLAVVAAAQPLRRRLQRFIDRRFYRHKYDASKTVAAFSARLRQEIDLDALSGELLAVVRDTMGPRGATIWLRRETPR